MAALLFPLRNFLCGLFSQALQWKGDAQVLQDVYVGKEPVSHHATEHNAVCPHFLHVQRRRKPPKHQRHLRTYTDPTLFKKLFHAAINVVFYFHILDANGASTRVSIQNRIITNPNN